MVDSQTTVLVAEDSRTQSVLFRSLLEKAGYRAVMAVNGREALEMIRNMPPDVVITDLNMPEMNGLELVEAVHADFPAIPIHLFRPDMNCGAMVWADLISIGCSLPPCSMMTSISSPVLLRQK